MTIPAGQDLVGRADLFHMKRQFTMSFMQGQGLQPQHRLCDFGCGILRGGIPLIDYLEPGHYVGVEVRLAALQQALTVLDESGSWAAGRAPSLVPASADLSAVDLGVRFQYVLAFSVLFHLTDDQLVSACRFIERHLADDGALYANVAAGQAAGSTWLEFPFIWRSMAQMESLLAAGGLRAEPIGTLAHFGHHSGISAQDSQIMLRATRAPTQDR